MATKKQDDSLNFVDFGLGPLGVPLFPSLGAGDESPDHIAVMKDPDGYVGRLALDADEESIRRAYGPGSFELICKNKKGQHMPGGRVKINIARDPNNPLLTPPATSTENTERDRALALYNLQKTANDDSRRMHMEQLALLKAEAQASRDNVKLELEQRLATIRAEADMRIEQERQRHTLDLERAKSERVAEAERWERSRAADETRNREFMLASQNNSKEFVALMTSIVSSNSKGADPLAFAQMLKEGVSIGASAGQSDPQTEALKMVGSGLRSMADIANSPGVRRNPQQRRAAPNGRQLPERANGAGGGSGAPRKLSEDKTERIQQKAVRLFKMYAADGVDPEEMLDEALEALDGEPVDDDGNPLDVEKDSRDTRDHGRASGSSSGRESRKRPTAKKPPVGDRAPSDGGRQATGRTRRNPAGPASAAPRSGENGKGGATARAAKNPVREGSAGNTRSPGKNA